MKKSAAINKDMLKAGRFLIPYRIYESNGPQVICVNGVQQSMGMWQTFVSRFAGNYRIVLFDFPGQGKAKVISGIAQPSLDEQVQILKAVIDKVEVGRDTLLCAASWGGVVAVSFAVKYPDRIKVLALASLGTKPNQKMVEIIKEGASIDMHDREKMAQVLIRSFGESLPALFKKKIIEQFHAMPEENIRSFYEHGLFVISSKRLSDMVDLRKIKARTILLNGENDTIIDLDDVRFMASLIPNCQMRIVKGVGHFLHMESESVLDLYEEILSSELRVRPKQKTHETET